MSDGIDIDKYRHYQRARALIEDLGMTVISKQEYATLKRAEACDFCGEKAVFSLCQTHMDEMRFLDTFYTMDGDYPAEGVMVLWCAGGDTYIGGYDPGYGWFEQGDDTHDPIPDVMWCELPSLSRMYEAMHSKGGEE